ncbi:MAG: glycosyltransferase family 25 protein [Planctomycetota bacterium]
MTLALLDLLLPGRRRRRAARVDAFLREHTRFVQQSDAPFASFDRLIVIALPERLPHMQQFLAALGDAPATILDAYRKACALADLDALGVLTRRAKEKLTPGQMACAVSHAIAWRHMLDAGLDHALIFEDDLQMPAADTLDRLVAFRRAADHVDAGWDMLYPGFCWEKARDEIAPGLLRLRGPMCMHAYVVRRRAAAMVLARAFPMRRIQDRCAERLIGRGRLRAYGPMPPVFNQDRAALGTTIMDTAEPMVLFRGKKPRRGLARLLWGPR